MELYDLRQDKCTKIPKILSIINWFVELPDRELKESLLGSASKFFEITLTKNTKRSFQITEANVSLIIQFNVEKYES